MSVSFRESSNCHEQIGCAKERPTSGPHGDKRHPGPQSQRLGAIDGADVKAPPDQRALLELLEADSTKYARRAVASCRRFTNRLSSRGPVPSALTPPTATSTRRALQFRQIGRRPSRDWLSVSFSPNDRERCRIQIRLDSALPQSSRGKCRKVRFLSHRDTEGSSLRRLRSR
jgi:hypothetical protein